VTIDLRKLVDSIEDPVLIPGSLLKKDFCLPGRFEPDEMYFFEFVRFHVSGELFSVTPISF